MHKSRKSDNLVMLGKRVPECVRETSELAADRLTELLGPFLSARFTPGEAIKIALDRLLSQMEDPGFSQQYIEQMVADIQKKFAPAPKQPKKR